MSSEMRTGYEEIFLLFLPTPIFGFQAGVLGLVGNGDSSFAIWGPSGVSRQTISKRTRWFAFSITGLFGKASGFPVFPRQELKLDEKKKKRKKQKEAKRLRLKGSKSITSFGFQGTKGKNRCRG